MNQTTTEPWHLDRKVPIALIFAIFMQTAAGIWWASSINQRVGNTEEKIAILKSNQAVTQTEITQQSRQVAVLVEQISNTNKNIERLQTEVRDTNTLLRDMLTENGGAP